MKTVKAFLAGVLEFRLTLTTSFDDDNLLFWYDSGRELAHRATFRYFEHY